MKADKYQIEAIIQRLESCISELALTEEAIEECIEDRVDNYTQDDTILEDAVWWLQSNEPRIALSKLREVLEGK